jgi:hypothetical protein
MDNIPAQQQSNCPKSRMPVPWFTSAYAVKSLGVVLENLQELAPSRYTYTRVKVGTLRLQPMVHFQEFSKILKMLEVALKLLKVGIEEVESEK